MGAAKLLDKMDLASELVPTILELDGWLVVLEFDALEQGRRLPVRCSVFGFLGDDVYVNRGRLAQEAVHC